MAFPTSRIPAVNVASVPQRSPLRYPGGKTWLVPHIREWLARTRPEILIEPFAGGGIVSLTAVMEGLVERASMVEIDRDVAAFWHAALRHGPELADRVRSFVPTRESVLALEHAAPRNLVDRGFRTLVLNRTRRSGIMAPGAAPIRAGENGRGIASRWYPETLARRLADIAAHAARIDFHEGDGMERLGPPARRWGREAAFFIDPPYTAGGKRAGRRLYSHSAIDHERLFEALAAARPNFLMTWDNAPEIAALVARHGFHATEVRMKNAHHRRLPELIVAREPLFARRESAPPIGVERRLPL